MKKELLAAALSAALLSSCSAQKSSRTDEDTATSASVTTAASTTTEALTTTATTAQVTTTAVTTEAEVTTTASARHTLHTDLCNIIGTDDEPRAEEDIQNISLEYMSIYSDSSEGISYEPTDQQKQLILDYIISHDLSLADDGDYFFFYDQGRSPDYGQLAFSVVVGVPHVPANHCLVFSKDRTVVGVKWNLAGEGDSYYQMEDAEQLAPVFDFAEQYAEGEIS